MTSTPPLLSIAEGRKPRLRGVRVPVPKELCLHMPVAKLLREYCKPQWQWAHYPAGEKRDVRTATKLKQMGAKRGRPEFELNSPDRGLPHYLELKRKGGRLTYDQEEFREWAINVGAPYVVAWNIDQVLFAFEQWECLKVKFTRSDFVG